MKPRHHVSRNAIELIKTFEGYRRKAARMADGRWTIGHGHTLTARDGAEVSESDAEALLLYDLIGVAHSVNEWTYTPLNQNQFDALCCFAFNIGLENFRGSSVLLRINEGSMLQAACAMDLWRKAAFEGEIIVVDALVRRRSAEKTLFLTPMDGWVAAPSPIVRPGLDLDAVGAIPRLNPTALKASMDGVVAEVERDETPGPQPELPHDADDSAPTPTETAAATVTSRLRTLFRTPEPPADAATSGTPLTVVMPAPEPPPSPRAETLAGLSIPLTAASGDRAFALTPPEEDLEPDDDDAPAPIELPVAANESEPDLFDPARAAANDPVAAPQTWDEARPLLLIDDTVGDFDAEFEFLIPEEPRTSFVPWILVSVLSLAVFAGGFFWAFNARGMEYDGLVNRATVGWLVGLLGIVGFATAAYRILKKLANAELDA